MQKYRDLRKILLPCTHLQGLWIIQTKQMRVIYLLLIPSSI